MATLIGATVALPAQAATDGFTEYDLAAGDVRASGITNGSDGATWFTEFAATKIGRITTSGAITTFDVPSTNDLPRIAAANDGNLWFTVDGPGDKIGRITPSGTVTLFDVPGANNRPVGIALGADNKIWFTELGAGKIGRIDPSAADPGASLIEFATPAGSSPTNLTTGPDGAIWFTESNRIGRFDPPAAVVTTTTTGGSTTSTVPPAAGVETTPPSPADTSRSSEVRLIQARTAVAMRHGPSSNDPSNGVTAMPRRSTSQPVAPSLATVVGPSDGFQTRT